MPLRLDEGMRTTRLDLRRPTDDDVAALHAILSDPRVWTHYPSLRHRDPDQTRTTVAGWIAEWQRDGSGIWVVRRHGETGLIGYGGCSLRAGAFWNLGYRLAPEAQGAGYATEVAAAGLAAARAARPDLPVVAYLLEHNTGSARVAERVGLTRRHRAPDAGNPDPDAIRLVYADRPLTPHQVAATLA